jgi:hypothetical protein
MLLLVFGLIWLRIPYLDKTILQSVAKQVDCCSKLAPQYRIISDDHHHIPYDSSNFVSFIRPDSYAVQVLIARLTIDSTDSCYIGHLLFIVIL